MLPLISNAQEQPVDAEQTANIEEQKAKETENANKLINAARDEDIETVSALLKTGVDSNIKDE